MVISVRQAMDKKSKVEAADPYPNLSKSKRYCLANTDILIVELLLGERTYIKSKIRKASNERNIIATMIVGRNIGRVNRKKSLKGEIPSTLATLKQSFGNVCKPANINNVINGVVFHTSTKIIANTAVSAPSRPRYWL